MKKSITLKEALCGFVFEFTYLNGKKLSLNNKENYTVIKPGYKKIIPGMGIKRENNVGNFIVEFDIKFPETLSLEDREKISEILPDE
jgi:DnaJ-class molecular chaperone